MNISYISNDDIIQNSNKENSMNRTFLIQTIKLNIYIMILKNVNKIDAINLNIIYKIKLIIMY